MLVAIHLSVVIVTVLFVLYSDEQALQWVRGKKQSLSKNKISFLHVAVTTGLTLTLITGGLLYLEAPAAFFSNSTFVVKMIAVGTLIINTYAIDRLSSVATAKPFSALPATERIPLFISGVASFVGWSTAVICGLLLS